MPRSACAITAVLSLVFAPFTTGQITDLTRWMLVQDPPNANLNAVPVPTVMTATLNALGGPIPAGTDIGYASINGNTAAGSSAGFAFDPGSDFALAIDFTLDWTNAVGAVAVGFGIGEDAGGVNSAGAVFAAGTGTQTSPAVSSPIGFAAAGAAARNDDNTVGVTDFAFTALPSGSGSVQGRFFVDYDAPSGDVTVGFSTTPGDTVADVESTIAGSTLDQWSGDPLLASFFLRSDGITRTVGPATVTADPFTQGVATATFFNLEVLAGAPFAVPEPAGAAAALLGLAMLTRRRFCGRA